MDRIPELVSGGKLLKWRLPKTSQQRFIAAGFLIAIMLGAFLFSVGYRSSIQFEKWNNLVIHARAVLKSLDDFSSAVKNAQLAAVSYYANGGEPQVQAFSTAESDAHAAISRARNLTVDNPIQQHNLDELSRLADLGIGLLRRVIQLHQDGKSGPDAMKPINEDAKKIGSPLGAALAATISEENRLLEIRTSEAAAVARRSRLLETIGSTFAMALVVLIGILCLREISIRADAVDLLERLNLELERRVAERTTALQTAIEQVRLENEERLAAKAAVSKLNAELEERVHQRTAELESANKELEAFCYSVSHDLRAPLRSIDGFSLALLEDHGGRLSDEGKTDLQRVRAATVRMGTLIDDLLDLSRIARSEMHREPVDLSQLAGSIASELRGVQPDRKVEFAIAPGLKVKGDLRLIRIALQNLLGNSWKFTSKQDHARIEFGRTQSNGTSSFFVGDNGAGFDPAFASRLFGAFQRLHAAADFPGTGIGLATVQRIVHRHGGDIWATSKVNEGATFFFTLEPHTHQLESK
ncbi:MAG: ATP-binding protein [Candidatus Acidiferrales bacterium]